MAQFEGKRIHSAVTSVVSASFDDADPGDFMAAVNICLAKSGTSTRLMQEVCGGETLVAFDPAAINDGCMGLSVDDPTDILRTIEDLVGQHDRDWTGTFDMQPGTAFEGGDSAIIVLEFTRTEIWAEDKNGRRVS
jgi:hypothetical protein